MVNWLTINPFLKYLPKRLRSTFKLVIVVCNLILQSLLLTDGIFIGIFFLANSILGLDMFWNHNIWWTIVFKLKRGLEVRGRKMKDFWGNWSTPGASVRMKGKQINILVFLEYISGKQRSRLIFEIKPWWTTFNGCLNIIIHFMITNKAYRYSIIKREVLKIFSNLY